MTTPKDNQTLAEHLASLGSLQDRINRFSRHIDRCDECKQIGESMCRTGERLKEEVSS